MMACPNVLSGEQGCCFREFAEMRSSPLSIGLLAVTLVTLPVSSASAQEFRHHHRYGLIGGVFGLAGAIVVGAATIVTAPIVILADVVSGGRDYRRGKYYERDGGYYYGGRSSYDYDGPNRYTDPRGVYPDAREYRYRRADRPYSPQDYAPSRDYDRDRSRPYAPDEAYNAPGRGYYSPDQYAPREGYYSPQRYYRDRPDYGPRGENDQGDNYSDPSGEYGSGQDYGPPPSSYRDG